MLRPMFGVESEYAVAAIGGRPPIRREDLVGRFLRVAGRRLPHIQDTGTPSGMFLENGARFYIDCGLHPELTTPETTNPFDLARYIKAGERILEGLTQEVQSEAGPATEIVCFRCNVDYSGSDSTWGCHESYLHAANPSNLPEQLVPHLVTRVIYTGAGGFNPLTSQLEFCVAPRLMHIQQTVSSDSTSNRGIFHTKNESLSANGYNRLHIICGESLCSETAIALKIGATALVVAMAEGGLQPCAGLRLAAPLAALHTVASDVTCKRNLRLAEGGEATAIEIQRRLLRLATFPLKIRYASPLFS
jgi:proteasome accessory factor A